MTVTPTRPVASVDELRRAWSAIQRGDFRDRPTAEYAVPDAADGGGCRPVPLWAPPGRVIPVLGALPQCGATTTALAVATAAAPAAVIECASAATSGLTSAATAELGTSRSGWALGRRDQVWIARASRTHRGAECVPVPDQRAVPAECGVLVLDVSWDLAHVLATPGWIRTAVLDAPGVVVVAAPSVPGVRRLETVLGMLAGRYALVAMVGPARRRWPRHVSAATGPLTRQAVGEERMVSIALDKHLATRGLDGSPLPGPLLAAAAELNHTLTTLPEPLEPGEPSDTSERPQP